jgi:hypothetical protein
MMGDDMANEYDIRPVDPPVQLRALDDVAAPDHLRRAIDAAVAGARVTRRARPHLGAWRPRLAGGLALAGAVAAALVVLGLFAGRILDDGGTAPGVRAVAPIALRTAIAPAPAARPGGEGLVARVGPIRFPTYANHGLHAVGARSDTVGGRAVRTVFYADAAGRRIGYAIADARLPVAGGQLVTRRGVQLRVLAHGATSIVTWRRDGRTCILAGRGVPVERLLQLASYEV